MPDKTDDEIIEQAKKRFQESQDQWADCRNEAIADIRFAKLGEQWPEDVEKARQGKPCLTINQLPTFIRQVVNDARINEPSIKVHPVDDDTDPETAEVINGLIRNIEQSSDAEIAYDRALDDAVTCGWGFFRVDLEYAHDDMFDLDIQVNPITNPNQVYFDAMSEAADAKDWRYCLLINDVPTDDFKARYPNAETSDWSGVDESGWVTEDVVKVAEYWDREEIENDLYQLSDGTVIHQMEYEKNIDVFAGLEIIRQRPNKTHKVTQYIMTGMEILETNDWPGSLIPICPVFGDDIIVDNKRYFHSLVRQAKDAQRNYNYWRSAATEKVASTTKAPWIGPTGAFETDADKWNTANTENWTYLQYDGQIPPQQNPGSFADAGSMSEALSANDDMKNIIGLQNASLGLASNETSGRAIMARQREGDVSTFHFIDNLTRGIEYGGRVILELIPHTYNTQRVIRVLGIDGEADTVPINQEFPIQNTVKFHDLTKGKYDLVVKTGPSFTSQREEAATQMTEMIRSFPDAAPIIGDLVAKNLDWPGADEIAKRLKMLLPTEIKNMESMEGLDPEAQIILSQAQQEIEQLQQVITQGQQMLAEKDEQITGLQLEKKYKEDELMFKNTDSMRSYQAAMAKIEADREVAKFKEDEETRRQIFDNAMEAMKAEVSSATNCVNEQVEPVTMEVQTLSGQLENIINAISGINQKLMDIEESKNKSISISAPSGQTYEGRIEDGQVQIVSPSGEVYNGTIED